MTRPRRRPRPTLAPQQPPPGPHILLGWVSGRTTGGHLVSAWCPWCLSWHQHGRPGGDSDQLHRVGHCITRPGLGDYTIHVLGWLSLAWVKWVKTTWAADLANRRHLLAARGYPRPPRVAWPAPYSPTPYEVHKRHQEALAPPTRADLVLSAREELGREWRRV